LIATDTSVIFTKDVDLYDRALILGAPPQVVHIAVGNGSNDRLFDLLTSEWDTIERSLESGL